MITAQCVIKKSNGYQRDHNLDVESNLATTVTHRS